MGQPAAGRGHPDAGDPGVEGLYAYTVEEHLRELLALVGATPDWSLIPHRLWRFYDQAGTPHSQEIYRLAATIETWWPAVEAAIVTGYSNARSEGYNRLAKHQGRNAFGLGNTANQQRRIRWHAPANTGGPQPRSPSCPVKFEEPSNSGPW